MNLREYMAERPVLEEWGPPARRLARKLYQKQFAIALAIAAALHLGSFLSGWAVQKIIEGRRASNATREVRLVPYRDLSAPPSLQQQAAAPPEFSIAPPSKPKAPPAGVPVPVPKEEAPVTTIASQTQLPFAGAEGDTGLGEENPAGVPWGEEGGTGIVIEEDALPSPDDFVPVEEQPVIIEMKAPDYPRLAREAGIEGVVTVRALVGKDGKVKDVLIGRSAHALLDEAALAAARLCVFKPAIQNKNPVAVWVAIPFNFHLN